MNGKAARFINDKQVLVFVTHVQKNVRGSKIVRRRLRGRFQLGRRGAAPLKRAIAYFEQAIARDSMLAQGYSGLAAAQGLLPLYGNADAF